MGYFLNQNISMGGPGSVGDGAAINYWTQLAESRQHIINQQAVAIQQLTEDNKNQRMQKDERYRRVRQLEAEVVQLRVKLGLPSSKRMEKTYFAPLLREAELTKDPEGLWNLAIQHIEQIQELQQQLRDNSDVLVKTELDDAIIKMEG